MHLHWVRAVIITTSSNVPAHQPRHSHFQQYFTLVDYFHFTCILPSGSRPKIQSIKMISNRHLRPWIVSKILTSDVSTWTSDIGAQSLQKRKKVRKWFILHIKKKSLKSESLFIPKTCILYLICIVQKWLPDCIVWKYSLGSSLNSSSKWIKKNNKVLH